MKLFLWRLKLTYILEQLCPNAPGSEVTTNDATLIREQITKWPDDDYLWKNYVLGVMVNKYYDQYPAKCKSSKELYNILHLFGRRGELKEVSCFNFMKFYILMTKSITN